MALVIKNRAMNERHICMRLGAVHHRQHQAQSVAVLRPSWARPPRTAFLICAHGAAALVKPSRCPAPFGYCPRGQRHRLSGQPASVVSRTLPVVSQIGSPRPSSGRPSRPESAVRPLVTLGVIAGGKIVHGQLRNQHRPVAASPAASRRRCSYSSGRKTTRPAGPGQHHHTGGEHKLPPIEAAGDTV